MNTTNEVYAYLLEEALKAVRQGVATVKAMSEPELVDMSTYEKLSVRASQVQHSITVEWTEYLR
jgi:hypothetical protein